MGTILWQLVPLLLAVGVIGSFFWFRLSRSDDPREMIVRWIITAAIGGILILVASRARTDIQRGAAILLSLVSCLVLIIVWRKAFGEMLGNWFASLYTGGGLENEAVPLYSIAEARRKQGKYQEAIEEVESQLARFPSDFFGHMLIAEIQAEDLKDLSSARETIERVLAQPGHAPKNIAFALTREADWHLLLNQDREAARAALERIVELLPETEQAQWALQRIAHLTPAEMLAEQNEPRRVVLKAGEGNVGLRTEPLNITPVEEDPDSAVARYVEQLQQFPCDSEAREKLALLYARHFQRMDLAADQMEQLISYPNQPPKQVVHWLNLLADLYVEGGDVENARLSLKRIAEQFPKSAYAENARNRIAYLRLEMRPKQKPQVMRLGAYEQNLGLRGPGPKRGQD